MCPICGRDDAGDRSTGYAGADYCSAACEEAALARETETADEPDDAQRACWAARTALLDLQQFVRSARTAHQALVLYTTIREIEADVAALLEDAAPRS